MRKYYLVKDERKPLYSKPPLFSSTNLEMRSSLETKNKKSPHNYDDNLQLHWNHMVFSLRNFDLKKICFSLYFAEIRRTQVFLSYFYRLETKSWNYQETSPQSRTMVNEVTFYSMHRWWRVWGISRQRGTQSKRSKSLLLDYSDQGSIKTGRSV